MQKGITIFALAALAVAAHAGTLIDDFTVANTDFNLDGTNNFSGSFAPLPGTLFQSRLAGGFNYSGNGADVMNVHVPGDGTATATSNGTASGTLELVYTTNTPDDLTGYKALSVTVSALSQASIFTVLLYSDNYNLLAGENLSVLAPGVDNFSFSAFSGTLDLTSVNRIFVYAPVAQGQSVTFTNVSLNAVPEPSSVAGMGLGVVTLFLRRRKRRA